MTYFAYVTPQWGAALLKGFLASVLLIVGTVALRVWFAMPTRRKPTTTENIEERLKEWLFKYGLSMKNDPNDSTHFRMFVVTDGGAKIFIGRRTGKWDEFISYTAELKASPEEVSISEAMTMDEKLRVVCELQLELSRAKISYKGLDYIQGFSITKTLPISSDLSEIEVLANLFDVEAVLNAALVVLRQAALRNSVKAPNTNKVIDGA